MTIWLRILRPTLVASGSPFLRAIELEPGTLTYMSRGAAELAIQRGMAERLFPER